MSTATNNPTATQLPLLSTSMLWRFVWKEFRMIRGLWLAVAVMGFAVQWVARLLMFRSPTSVDPDLPFTMFAIGLVAAVLYTVGAAATTFSVEHEEETFGFLVRLPATWPSVFAGKLLVALVSALLLAAVLLATGWVLQGSPPPGGVDRSKSFGMFGFAILEALVWGTLFSLLIKRPLLAAIVTLVAGTLITTMAVNYASRDSLASLTPDAYIRAVPLRATIVALVLACSLYAASSWLTVGSEPGLVAVLRRDSRLMIWLAGGQNRVREIPAAAQRVSRRGMLARLLWQIWRESWKLLFAPVGVAALLTGGISAALGLAQAWGEVSAFVMASAGLFAPAIYGTMAFYVDQRRGNYRFLAEHAARPRYVWLSRHIVWLGAHLIIWFLMIVVLIALQASQMDLSRRQVFEYYLDWGISPSAPSMIYNLAVGGEIVFRVLLAASFGALVAYGVGQLFSMTIRSEILAAFLALLFTPIVATWTAVTAGWQLSPILFVFPIFAGLMLATWLRAPDWIASRNSFRAWWKPALAIIAPFVFMAALLPGARLAQMQREQPRVRDQLTSQVMRDQQFADRLADFQAGGTTEAARTADMYMQLAAQLHSGKSQDLLKRWEKPKYYDAKNEIDEAKIPPVELFEFKKAQKQQMETIKKGWAKIINEAIEISKRPTCRFHFDPNWFAPASPDKKANQPKDPAYANRPYSNVNQLVGIVAGEPMSEPDQPARRFLAALKMQKHLRSGQPTVVVINELNGERIVLQRIADWALASGRTKEELRDVLEKLTTEFAAPESPAEALLADHLLIRAAIEGKETPFILSGAEIEPHAYVAYLTNQLWWERDRGLQALERITRRNIQVVDELANRVRQTKPHELGSNLIRRSLRPDYGGLPETWKIQEPAAVTSYFVSLEYDARAKISDLCRAYGDNETCRRATLLQIALALYKIDHKQYPPQLSDLVPDYLEELPLDPYARQPFQYLPNGLNLPLSLWTYGREYDRIEPHTPLLWSVGAGDARIKEVIGAAFSDPDDSPPDGKKLRSEMRVRQYEFINEDQGWQNNNTLAFPLPK